MPLRLVPEVREALKEHLYQARYERWTTLPFEQLSEILGDILSFGWQGLEGMTDLELLREFRDYLDFNTETYLAMVPGLDENGDLKDPVRFAEWVPSLLVSWALEGADHV
jgi:hypothetical protein